jgi:hypothetical protein
MMRILLAAVPSLMITLAVPLANRTQPHVAGLPFVLAWLIAWVLLAPAFLFAADRLRRRA